MSVFNKKAVENGVKVTEQQKGMKEKESSKPWPKKCFGINVQKSFKKNKNRFVEEKLKTNTSNMSSGQIKKEDFGEVFRFETVDWLERKNSTSRRKTKLPKKLSTTLFKN